MKKIIAMVAFLAAGVAQAGGFGSIEYQDREGVNGGSDARATKITFGTSLTDSTKIDFSLRQKTDTDNNLKDNRLEAGLTYSTAPIVGSLTGYARGAVGQKYKTAEDYTYYSVEPGVKYAITDALTVKAGYRYRAATDSTNADTTRAWRVGGEYALTKNYSVGLGYDRVRGDSEYNSINVALGFKF